MIFGFFLRYDSVVLIVAVNWPVDIIYVSCFITKIYFEMYNLACLIFLTLKRLVDIAET